jgi:hypothetical protein
VIKGSGEELRQARALGDVQERLQREFPTTDADRIAELLAGCYRRTAGATAEQFRAVLAEREARARLRSEAMDVRSVVAAERREAGAA